MKIEREQGIFLLSISTVIMSVHGCLSCIMSCIYGTLVSGRIIVCFPQMNESFF